MTMSIRDPRAAELARKLAQRRGTTMTQAVVQALKESLQRDLLPLESRFMVAITEFNKHNPNVGHSLSKDDIDRMWEG
jgi:antitoxin VapB